MGVGGGGVRKICTSMSFANGNIICDSLVIFMGGKAVRSLLRLSERWPCHIWHVGWMKSAYLRQI